MLPPVYYGNALYFHHWLKAEKVAWDTDHRFPKQTYRNRCHILGANGVIKCSIPVTKPNGSKSNINEILISNAEDWPKDHWKSIESAYRSTPFFEHYGPKVKKVLTPKHEKLVDHCIATHFQLCEMMHISGEEKVISTFDDSFQSGFDICSPKNKIEAIFPKYEQAFFDKLPFESNLSILDLLFNLGPETIYYLQEIEA